MPTDSITIQTASFECFLKAPFSFCNIQDSYQDSGYVDFQIFAPPAKLLFQAAASHSF